MREDYYQKKLYPLQNRVLRIIESVDNNFYLTGGTALSRAYLNHRYSDDLDFFVNADITFKHQVEQIYSGLQASGFTIEKGSAQESHTRWFIQDHGTTLKVDFVNDESYRVGHLKKTDLFERTDSMRNILSNKVTALGRLEAKDIADIVFIARNLAFNWREIMQEAEQKDMWANPVEVATLLKEFPVQHIRTVAWIEKMPDQKLFQQFVDTIIQDLIRGQDNSLTSNQKS
jgi:predicted nucleotidyltransferase component of viral defense system